MWIMKFYLFDLDLNPVTFVLKHDINITKMYKCTKNEVPTFSSSKGIAWKDRETETQTDAHTNTHIDTHQHTETRLKLPTRIRG